MRPRARRWLVSTAVGISGSLMASGGSCDGELGQQFREASRDEFEAGVNALLDGVVQGAFEAYDPDEDAAAS